MIDDNIKYDNKCSTCGTWSVENSKGDFNNGGYEMCMDGKERWFTNYWCLNCNRETSISEDDDWNTIEDGESVLFE